MHTSYYDPTPKQLKLASLGRKLITISETMPMKGLTDEQIGRTNRMASFGEALTRIGTVFGPANVEELLKVSGVELAEAEEFLKEAKGA